MRYYLGHCLSRYKMIHFRNEINLKSSWPVIGGQCTYELSRHFMRLLDEVNYPYLPYNIVNILICKTKFIILEFVTN